MRQKAAAGNKRLTDFEELRDMVISHRAKTRNVRCCFGGEKTSDQYLNEFVK